jgi:hypothetical protein
MNDSVALGYGYHQLEDSFRWTGENFSIHILETDITGVSVKLGCNKPFPSYSVKYSLDNWKSEKTIELNDGDNLINISVAGMCEIKFKSTYFIPSELSFSTDFRKLGVRMSGFFIKKYKNVLDIHMKDVLFKYDMWDKSTYKIDNTIGHVTLIKGWHELEGNNTRWSNGCGDIKINTNKYDYIKINILAPKEQLLEVVINGEKTLTERVFRGSNEICLDLKDVKIYLFDIRTVLSYRYR